MHVTPTTDTQFPSIRFVASVIETAGTKTTMETTTDNHTHGNSAGATHTTITVPPAPILNSLILPTDNEPKETHYRIASESREVRERAGREFRVGQPGIYA